VKAAMMRRVDAIQAEAAVLVVSQHYGSVYCANMHMPCVEQGLTGCSTHCTKLKASDTM
jgi:alkylhydroperoxidase family enzyme